MNAGPQQQPEQLQQPPVEAPASLEYTERVYTLVSSVFGTEGAPSKEFKYTISL